MKYCQLCSSSKTKQLNGALYCENCEIYFTLKNGSQLIKTLPITETHQRSLNLCATCSKKAGKNTPVKCRVFKEYLRKLPFCKQCKTQNLHFLKNSFFKNFLLYKKIKKAFGLMALFVLLALWSVSEKTIALMYYYIEITLGDMSLMKLIVTLIAMYNLIQYSFMRMGMFLVCLYKILFRKITYFEIPVNFMNPKDLDGFLSRLSIKSMKDDASSLGTV